MIERAKAFAAWLGTKEIQARMTGGLYAISMLVAFFLIRKMNGH
jgi:hypothetical protein